MNLIETLETANGSGNKPLALLLIDIDDLGRINDTSGHAVGDRLIRKVGQTVALIAAPGMTFRVDADEFAVLIEGTAVDLSRISAETFRPVSTVPVHRSNLDLREGGSNPATSCSQ